MLHLLDDDVVRNTMRKKAYQYGRSMVWPAVTTRYMESFHTARLNRRGSIRRPSLLRTPELPEVKLDHLLAMTDDTGLFQHAIYTTPNYAEGYTLDDNARALIAAVLLEEESRMLETHSPSLQRRYLAFVRFCFDPEAVRFHNFVGYDRRWLDGTGSEDSHGRALWRWARWSAGRIRRRCATPPPSSSTWPTPAAAVSPALAPGRSRSSGSRSTSARSPATSR